MSTNESLRAVMSMEPWVHGHSSALMSAYGTYIRSLRAVMSMEPWSHGHSSALMSAYGTYIRI